MRKTQMNLPKGGCASETIWTTWDSINWDKVARAVKSLQARIVKAVKAKHFHKGYSGDTDPPCPVILTPHKD